MKRALGKVQGNEMLKQEDMESVARYLIKDELKVLCIMLQVITRNDACKAKMQMSACYLFLLSGEINYLIWCYNN